MELPTGKQIMAFLKVAEAGSFYKASQELYISSSAVIQQVNLLEEAVGFELFHRDRKGVRLTEAGAYYYREIRQIVKQMESAVNEGRRIADQRPVTLRVGYVLWYAAQIAMETGKAVHASGNTMSMQYVDRENAVDAIRAGRIDCCIVPMGELTRKKELEHLVIKSIPLHIGMPPGCPVASKDRVCPTDFENRTLILPKPGLFDSADGVRAMLAEHNIPVNFIDNDDHLDATGACLKYNGWRISADAPTGTELVYKPLDAPVRYEFAVLFDKPHAAFIKSVLAPVIGQNG